MRIIDEERISAVHRFIQNYHQTERKTPTLRQICRGCSISSTSAVSRIVKRLEERELISLVFKEGRSFIAVPENLSVGQSRPASIVGSCPCGEPVLAAQNIISTVALPVEIFGEAEHFMLYAKGRSMINRGIFDGDLMVVRVQNTANVGDVVIARVNDDEATAKVLAKLGGNFYLKAANDELNGEGKRIYGDIYPKGNWEILGVVDSVIHKPDRDVR